MSHVLPASKKGYAKATYGYDAQTEHELSFDEGEIIVVLNKFENQPEYAGWWYGHIDDYYGMFPVAYTEPHFKEEKKVAVDNSKTSDLIKKMQAECGFLSGDRSVNALNAEFDDLSKALKEEKERKQKEAEAANVATTSNQPAVDTSQMDTKIIVNLQKQLESLNGRLLLAEKEKEEFAKTKEEETKKRKKIEEEFQKIQSGQEILINPLASVEIEELREKLAVIEKEKEKEKKEKEEETQKRKQAEKDLQSQLDHIRREKEEESQKVKMMERDLLFLKSLEKLKEEETEKRRKAEAELEKFRSEEAEVKKFKQEMTEKKKQR